MKPIGGFFELELPAARRSFHPEAMALCTGRACVSLIAERLKPERVFLPCYSCESLAAPLVERGIAIEYLAINEDFDLTREPVLSERDALIYVNYFGMKQEAVHRYARHYGRRVILDNTQAFFERSVPGAYSFNSARKFFGVPDGAYLYAPEGVDVALQENDQVECTHLVQRFNGRQREAYEAFRRSEASLTCVVRRMSPVSEALLSLVDYPAVSKRRQSNFDQYQARLGARNRLKPQRGQGVPFCYPFLPTRPIDRSDLAEHDIFIPTLWPETAEGTRKEFAWERDLAAHMLPLPVDHRYGETDIAFVVAAHLLERCAD